MGRYTLQLDKLNTGINQELFATQGSATAFMLNVDNLAHPQYLTGVKSPIAYELNFNLVATNLMVTPNNEEIIVGYSPTSGGIVTIKNLLTSPTYNLFTTYLDKNMQSQPLPFLSDVKIIQWNRNTLLLTANELSNPLLITYIHRKYPLVGNQPGDSETIFYIGTSEIYTKTTIDNNEVIIPTMLGGVTYIDGQPNGGFFETGYWYEWGVSLVYDGYIDSQIQYIGGQTAPSGYSTYNRAEFTISLELSKINYSLNKRITGIKLHRRTSTTPILGEVKITEWLCVQDIPISTAWTKVSAGSNSYRLLYNVIDNGHYITTSENMLGANPFVQIGLPKYKSCIKAGIYQIAWNVSIEGIPESATFILRSLPGKHSVFDYLHDFVSLPSKVITAVYFLETVYIFTERGLYSLDLNSMELQFIGLTSLLNSRAVTVTSDGIFWAGYNSVYGFVGKNKLTSINEVIDIGSKILNNSITVSGGDLTLYPIPQSYKDILTDAENVCVIHLVEQRAIGVCCVVPAGEMISLLVIFAFDYKINEWYMYYFHLEHYPYQLDVLYYYNSTFIIAYNRALRMFYGNRLPFSWWSKIIPDLAKRRKFYYIRTRYQGENPMVKYTVVNNGYLEPNTQVPYDGFINTYGRGINVFISGHQTKVFNIDLIIRDLVEDK